MKKGTTWQKSLKMSQLTRASPSRVLSGACFEYYGDDTFLAMCCCYQNFNEMRASSLKYQNVKIFYFPLRFQDEGLRCYSIEHL